MCLCRKGETEFYKEQGVCAKLWSNITCPIKKQKKASAKCGKKGRLGQNLVAVLTLSGEP